MSSIIDDRFFKISTGQASFIMFRCEIAKPSRGAQPGVPQMVRRAQPQMQLGQGHGDFDELGWVRIDR
jgi:hypothetical protein